MSKKEELEYWRAEAERECRYKNKAYFFIISCGLIEDFAEYCREYNNRSTQAIHI